MGGVPSLTGTLLVKHTLLISVKCILWMNRVYEVGCATASIVPQDSTYGVSEVRCLDLLYALHVEQAWLSSTSIS